MITLRILLLSLLLLAVIGIVLLICDKIFRTNSVRACILEILLLLLLLVDLTFLLTIHTTSLVSINPPLIIQLLLLAFSFTWIGLKIWKNTNSSKISITQGSIREAIDNLPSGLCFSQKNGMSILVNRKMEELSQILTGSTLLNSELLWRSLEEIADKDGIRRLNHVEPLVFELTDASVWRFTRIEIEADNISYNQIFATDITKLYRLSEDLATQNAELVSYQQRIKRLLENIAEIKNAEEILAFKMRVHDKLGQCILTTRRWLVRDNNAYKANELAEQWHNILRFLEINFKDADQPLSYAMRELIDSANVLGCEIVLEGVTFDETVDFPLLKNAVREAMTNAVRHAGATRLTVNINIRDEMLHAIITDNGTKSIQSITEGSGLSTLRSKIEQAGGLMEVRCSSGVELYVIIPRGRGEYDGGFNC